MQPQNCEKCTEVRATSSSVITVSTLTEISAYVRRTVSEFAIPKVPQEQSICKSEPGVGLRG